MCIIMVGPFCSDQDQGFDRRSGVDVTVVRLSSVFCGVFAAPHGIPAASRVTATINAACSPGGFIITSGTRNGVRGTNTQPGRAIGSIGKRIKARRLLHRVPRRRGSARLAEVRNIFEIGSKTRNWHGRWNPIGLAGHRAIGLGSNGMRHGTSGRRHAGACVVA
jgi:hypothetical protein